ncbi:MAG: hypothetical protein IPJ54_15210 [Saprospiraceae bacterium]|nr:hypothetical protein [Saprospiraceae bacterium]
MIEHISLPYPWWFILFCLLAGAAYAYVLYSKERKFEESGKWVKPSMAAFRAFSVFVICVLLLAPIIKSIKEEQKEPIIIVAKDVSQSIKLGVSNEQNNKLNNDLESLRSKLASKYQVEQLEFADQVRVDTTTRIALGSSNLSQAVQYIYDNYADQNVGAIVMVSDGIYNEGGHPAYAPVQFSAPLYTVALGDTSIRKDLLVKNVLSNRIAYLGDQFPIQVDISALSCQGGKTKLSLERTDAKGKQLLAQKDINITQTSFFTTADFVVDANQIGVIKYTVSVNSLSGEVSTANNKKDIYVEVLDGRQNVLILGNAAHPDLAAFQQLISTHKNYKSQTAIMGVDKPNLADFDVIIAHNLPSDQHDWSAELAIIKNKKIPVIYVAGTQVNQSRLNGVQDVLKIKGNSRSNEDTEVALANGFDLFTLSEDLKAKVVKFPPLVNLFGTYEGSATSQVLFHQKIKKIPTRYPLLAFHENNGVKTGVLCGEGVWKWKMQEFASYQSNEACQELVNKMVQLVAAKDDKRKFKVNLPKQIFKDNENIVFDAQLFNDSYEMFNEPEVFMSLRDENRKEYKYNFSKTGNYYLLDIGQLPSGNFTFQANTTTKGQPQVFNGKFSVEALQLEAYDLTARHDVLAALSKKFNGSLYPKEQIEKLADDILRNPDLKPTIFQTSHSKTLIHFKWLFFLIIALLSSEWFMRRYYGSY